VLLLNRRGRGRRRVGIWDRENKFLLLRISP
jgi:hypothetical protein